MYSDMGSTCKCNILHSHQNSLVNIGVLSYCALSVY